MTEERRKAIERATQEAIKWRKAVQEAQKKAKETGAETQTPWHLRKDLGAR